MKRLIFVFTLFFLMNLMMGANVTFGQVPPPMPELEMIGPKPGTQAKWPVWYPEKGHTVTGRRSPTGGDDAPTSGLVRQLTICIDFADRRYTAEEAANCLSNYFGNNVTPFYSEQSLGKMMLQYDQYSSVVTLGNFLDYCQDQENCFAGPNNVQRMVKEAILRVDPTTDWRVYDNNHDGIVEGLAVKVNTLDGAAGYTPAYWPHAWGVDWLKLDGVWVGSYHLTTVRDGPADFLLWGIEAHETCHDLWLSVCPDVYANDPNGKGIEYSLMGGGSWWGYPAANMPAPIDPWIRGMLGWTQETFVSSTQNVTLIPWKTNGKAIRLALSTNEDVWLVYFNDQWTPENGLGVFIKDRLVSVQEFVGSKTTPKCQWGKHYGLSQIQSSGNLPLELNVDGSQLFPGTGNVKGVFPNGGLLPGLDSYYNNCAASPFSLIRIGNPGGTTLPVRVQFGTIDLWVDTPPNNSRLDGPSTVTIRGGAFDLGGISSVEWMEEGGKNWKRATLSNRGKDADWSFDWSVPGTIGQHTLHVRLNGGEKQIPLTYWLNQSPPCGGGICLPLIGNGIK